MNVVVVFPGQGAQRQGMARDFCRSFAIAASTLAEASDACGADLARVCFGGDSGRLRWTEFAQPAIVAVEIAMLRAATQDLGLRPTHFAGHSVGEYTALVAAGVLPLAGAVALLRERGRLMEAALASGRGGMLALLGRDCAAAVSCLGPLPVDVAAVNAPGQVVLSGLCEDLAAARERISLVPELRGIRFHPLAVSTPFHSRFMAAAEPGFRLVLEQASQSWTPAAAGLVACNVTGGLHVPDRAALTHALTRHLSGQVRWLDNMQTLLRLDPARIVEIGPTSQLRGFFALLRRRIDPVTTVAEARLALVRRPPAAARVT